jgi:hypothetical protein
MYGSGDRAVDLFSRRSPPPSPPYLVQILLTTVFLSIPKVRGMLLPVFKGLKVQLGGGGGRHLLASNLLSRQ